MFKNEEELERKRESQRNIGQISAIVEEKRNGDNINARLRPPSEAADDSRGKAEKVNIESLKNIKNSIRLIKKEIDNLNLSKEQAAKLKQLKDGANKEIFAPKERIKNILTEEQITKVKFIRNEINKINREKFKTFSHTHLNQALRFKGHKPSILKRKYNIFRWNYKRHIKKQPTKKEQKKNLTTEQLSKLSIVEKKINKLNLTEEQILELNRVKGNIGKLSQDFVNLNFTKNQIDSIAELKDLANDLKLTKEQIKRRHITNSQIFKLNFLIQQIAKKKLHKKYFTRKYMDKKCRRGSENSETQKENIKSKKERKKINEEKPNIKVPKIRMRYACYDDIPSIRKLCNANSENTFGFYGLFHLIGESWLSIVLINEEGHIAAFMVFNDYPNVPYLPKHGWEQWFLNMYLTKEYSAVSARFLHFLVWDENLADKDFLEKAAWKVFGHDPCVKYLLFIMPPGQTLCYPYSTIFEHYLLNRDLENEFRSVKKTRLNLQRYTLDLYVAYRRRFGPTVRLLNSHETYKDRVNKNLRKMAPFILKLFGKNFYNALISSPTKKRATLTAEWSHKDKKGIGIMTLTKKINTKMLEEYFDTFPYHGFRMPTKDDTWYKIYLRRQVIEDTKKLKPEMRPITELNEDKRVTHHQSSLHEYCSVRMNKINDQVEKIVLGYENESEKDLQSRIDIEDEALEYQNDVKNKINIHSTFINCNQPNLYGKIMDMDLRLARPTGMPFTPEEINTIRTSCYKHTDKFICVDDLNNQLHCEELKELKQFIKKCIASAQGKEAEAACRTVGIDKSSCDFKRYEECRQEVINGHMKLSPKINDNPYSHMDKLCLWEVNGVKKQKRPSTDTRVQYHGRLLAIAIELFIPSYMEHPMCTIKYLKAAFRQFPGKEYCLITVPPHQEEMPLLHYFQKLCSRKKNSGLRDLYVCHKLGVMGKHSVREGLMADFEEMIAMSYNLPQARQIHLDVLSILLEESTPPSYLQTDPDYPLNTFDGTFKYHGSETKCFVLMASSTLVGYAVAAPNYDMAFYLCHYKMEKFVWPNCHAADGHGFVRHLVIAPLFRHLTRFFLRGIMKLCNWTTLVALALPQNLHQKYPRYSVVQGLEHWIQVSPRILPQYWKLGLGTRTPGWGKRWDWKHRPPKALNLMTYHGSGIRKKLFTCHIVVVGVGDTALSFLEHLIFNPSNEHIGFRFITVISSSGFPLQYPDGFHKAVTMMMTDTSARYDQEYLDKLCLETWLTSIYGYVTFIDRQNKVLSVDGKTKIHYDYLFLFCGCQFLPLRGSLEVKEKPCIVDNAFEAVKDARELPTNVFVINNHLDAYQALTNLTTSFKFLGNVEGSQVVVYGSCIEALSCVSALLEFGIEGNKITLIMNPQESSRTTMYIRSPEIKKAVLQTLAELNVTVHHDYTFRNWEETEFYSAKFIKNAQFEAVYNKIKINVIGLFTFHQRSISHRAYLVCQSGGLAYDDKLIINPNFITSCTDIYAGGPFTKYSSVIKTDAFNHEFYNSVEIGAEVAKNFLQRVLSKRSKYKDNWMKNDLVSFTYPLVHSANFPGGWKYLRITRPGKGDVLESERTLGSKLLKTGDPNDTNGHGFFQIMVDAYGVVNDIMCYSASDIDVKNLIHVYGKHECLLNNLLYKFEGKQIGDLFGYFREPWAYAIYHDRFPLLMKNIDAVFLKKLPYEDVSFFDVVAHAFDVEKWQRISDKDRDLLEDLFNLYPTLKQKIEQQVQNFLENNEYVLTTYMTKKNMKTFQDDLKSSRVADNFEVERGSRPLTDHVPKHIVPEIHQRREMVHRPVEITEPALELGSENISEEENKIETIDNEHLSQDETAEKNLPDYRRSSKGTSSNATSDYSEKRSDSQTYSFNPYSTGLDEDEEVQFTVRPELNRNISHISIAVEEIEFAEAVRKKFSEFKQCLEQESIRMKARNSKKRKCSDPDIKY